ncbi:MAG: substrate-binding domain-containing protein [Muribaculaceae bacterium]|nr:substrate-binding domain-containing protein [Muribaculaceae bacterium]
MAIKIMYRKYILPLLGIILASVTSCTDKTETSSTSGSSLLYCDESFENIMAQEIDVFEYIYPKSHVLARYGTENEAVDSLKALTYRTIVIPRELTEKETQYIKSKNRVPRSARIAVDAVALIVNPENPIEKVSMKEISEILSGETRNWIDLNPSYPDKPIAVLVDKPGSSMTNYMRDSLLIGKPFSANVHAQGSINGVVDAVKKDRWAIGVIGVSWLTSDLKSVTTIDSIAVDAQDNTKAADMGEINERLHTAGVKALGVMRDDDPKAYRPYQEEIYSGKYPLTRSIYMITVSPSGSPAGGFFSFVTGHIGQKLIMKTGVLPARMQINVVELVP